MTKAKQHFVIMLAVELLATTTAVLAEPPNLDVPSDKRVLTLAEARKTAFQNNWDLLAARSGVDLATAQKIVSHEFPNPTTSVSVQKINVDSHPSGTISGNGIWDRNYDTILAFNQLFEIGGKRKNRQVSAIAGLDAAKAQLWDAKRSLDAAVTKAYITALLAEENAKILHRSSLSLRQEADIAETRLEAGDISRADKTQIEIAADRFELDASTAESNARNARIAVEVFLGSKEPRGNWVPGDGLDSLASLIQTASQTSPGAIRPDLIAAEATLKKTEADLKLQKSMRIPDPTILVQYEHEPPDQPNTIGLGVSIPLPLWNHNKGNIQAAAAAREQARLQLDKTKAQTISDLASAEVSYASAIARWKRYNETIRPKSEDVLKTVEFAYKKGGAPLLELLTAERNDNDIRVATAQALADSAAAAADLAAAKNISADSNLSHDTKGTHYE